MKIAYNEQLKLFLGDNARFVNDYRKALVTDKRLEGYKMLTIEQAKEIEVDKDYINPIVKPKIPINNAIWRC
jgi:hypothetical protein